MRKYRTIQGDNWDMIAFRVYKGYGGEKLTSALIDANPAHVMTVEFSAGVILDIPEVYIPAAKTLPPWLRG